MRTHLGLVTIAGTWITLSAALCAAQTAPANNPAPCTVAPQPEPCSTKPASSAKPDAAQKFPFPGEPSAPATAPSIGGVPDAPGAPAPAANGDAAKKFPFPGEPAKPDLSGGNSNSSSSSSSGDDAVPADSTTTPDSTAPADPGLKDKGSEGTTTTGRHILHRVNPPGTKLQTADERLAEDLDIAHFYTQTGDLQGAYLRSQDAVKTAPDDPDAHFALAEIAAKLNKKDEAIAEYNACLKLDPSDKQIKESRKALSKLQH